MDRAPLPFHADTWLTIYGGDCRAVLAAMEPESVNCVVTSPPYYGLRDYGLPTTAWGGDPAHAHEWGSLERGARKDTLPADVTTLVARTGVDERQSGAATNGGRFCACGAWSGCFGLEPTPELFTEHLVDVFHAIHRVLRKDGTVWLNLGDSYASHDPGDRRDGQFLNPEGKQYDKGRRSGPAVRNRAGIYRTGTLKAKDRLMMPARVAIALRDDGWWLRDEIVWAKPNPMPSSVEDRTTPAHEMVYLLTKSARYAYDGDAIRERATSGPSDIRKMVEGRERIGGLVRTETDPLLAGSSLTNVGRKRAVGGKPPRAKTATDPNARGARQAPEPGEPNAFHPLGRNKRSVWTVATQPYPEAHFATFPEALVEPMILAGCPAGGVVLDPFAGSGTVGLVAERLGRRSVLIDLSPDYLAQMVKRIAAGRSSGEGPALDMPVPAPSGSLWEATG